MKELTLGCEGREYWMAVARNHARILMLSEGEPSLREAHRLASGGLLEVTDMPGTARERALMLLRDECPQLRQQERQRDSSLARRAAVARRQWHSACWTRLLATRVMHYG